MRVCVCMHGRNWKLPWRSAVTSTANTMTCSAFLSRLAWTSEDRLDVTEGCWRTEMTEGWKFSEGRDVHWQFRYLWRALWRLERLWRALLRYGGFPPESNYLFLGDYVDRSTAQPWSSNDFFHTLCDKVWDNVCDKDGKHALWCLEYEVESKAWRPSSSCSLTRPQTCTDVRTFFKDLVESSLCHWV